MAISAQYNIPFVAAAGAPSEVTVNLGTENTHWEAGDVAVIMLWSMSTAARTWAQKAGTTGWTLQTENDWNISTDYFCHGIATKVLGASEANPVFVHATGGGGIGAVGVILRGVDGTTPLDGVSVTKSTGTGAAATAPTLNTATANAWALRGFVWFDNSTAVGSYTNGSAEIFEGTETGSSVGSTYAMSYELVASAGAAGATDAVASGGGISAGDAWSAFTLSIRPESVPAVTFDASTKTIAAAATTSLTVTASPVFGSAMTTITTPGGDTISAESGATTSSATFLIPSLAQFASGGTMNNTRLSTAGNWSVTDGAASATASLTIQPPSGYFLRTLSATTGAIPADIDAGTPDSAIGDDILAWGDDLNDVDTLGDVNVSAMPTTVNYRWYDVSGTAWQADDSISVAAAVVLTATTDEATYATGANIVISLDPNNVEAPNAMTLAGVNVFADFTATGTTGGTLVAPSTADFLPAGAFNAVPWFQFLDLVVGFAAADDSTAQILFTGPAGANESGATDWCGSVGEAPAGLLTGYAEGDLWYLTAPANDIASIDNGVITPLAAVGAMNLYIYTAGAWTDEGPVLIQLGTIANYTVRAGQTVTITPVFAGNDGDAVFTIQAGTLPDGITINSSTGVISGTAPSDLVSYPELFDGLIVRMTDGSATADSNEFSVTVRAAENAIIRSPFRSVIRSAIRQSIRS